MARICVVVVAFLILLGARAAHAQMGAFAGHLTPHLGVASGGDVRDASVTPGISLAVLDHKGFGVELDVAQFGDFDEVSFADSRVTSAMLNFVAMYPSLTVRPYVVVGAGVLRLRTSDVSGTSVGRTEGAWNAGAGVLYMLNDVVGIRGDARYFRHFEGQADSPLPGDRVLDFWRTSAGVTLSWTLR